jgi:hypothetical protein
MAIPRFRGISYGVMGISLRAVRAIKLNSSKA